MAAVDASAKSLPPIFTTHLFPGLEAKLMESLRSLPADTSPAEETISEVTIPQEIAWRIFTKGIAPEEARTRVQIAGDDVVALHILKMISIVG
jgi:hypothetical protein